MTTKSMPQANALHAAYQRLTGLEISLTLPRIYALELWASRGWTEADLALVVARLKKLIAEGRKWQSALLFRRLIEDLDGFEEILSESRALARVPKRDANRDRALASTGRVERNESPAKSAASILAASAAFERFRALKETL